MKRGGSTSILPKKLIWEGVALPTVPIIKTLSSAISSLVVNSLLLLQYFPVCGMRELLWSEMSKTLDFGHCLPIANRSRILLSIYDF